MWQDIAAIIMGPLIIYSWWVQTYTDSWVADLWRGISRERMTKNMAAVTYPCIGLISTVGGIGMLSERFGAPYFVMVSARSLHCSFFLLASYIFCHFHYLVSLIRVTSS